MSFYHVCPRCGAHLDPGETCDCLEVEARVLIGHLADSVDKKTALDATNIQDGKQTPHVP